MGDVIFILARREFYESRRIVAKENENAEFFQPGILSVEGTIFKFGVKEEKEVKCF